MPDLLQATGLGALADEVLVRLTDRIGPRVELVRWDSTAPRAARDADLAFFDRQSGKIVLVEVKGRPGSGDLTLGMIPYMRQVKEAAAPHEAVLVSRSPVSPLLRTAMDAYGIPIVEVARGENGAAELAAVIAELVQ